MRTHSDHRRPAEERSTGRSLNASKNTLIKIDFGCSGRYQCGRGRTPKMPIMHLLTPKNHIDAQVRLCRIWVGEACFLYTNIFYLQCSSPTNCELSCYFTQTRVSLLNQYRLQYCRYNISYVAPFLDDCCVECISIIYFTVKGNNLQYYALQNC